MVRSFVFLIALAGIASCYRDNDPNLPPPDVVLVEQDVDAASPCGRACARLASFGCSEGKPSRAGTSCTTVCTRNQDLLPVSCIGAAQTLADIRACGVRCMP
jgi:hypothetical protein